MRPVAQITGQEFQRSSNDNRSLRQRVIEFFNSIGNKVTRQDLGDIELNTSGVRDSLAHGYGRLKAATFSALPQVLKNGALIAHNGPYEGHNYDSYIISAPVNVNGDTVYVGALVIKDRMQRYKLHEVLTASKSGAPLFQSEATSQGADGPLRNDTPLGEPGGSPTISSILPEEQDVNQAVGPESSVGAARSGFAGRSRARGRCGRPGHRLRLAMNCLAVLGVLPGWRISHLRASARRVSRSMATPAWAARLSTRSRNSALFRAR